MTCGTFQRVVHLHEKLLPQADAVLHQPRALRKGKRKKWRSGRVYVKWRVRRGRDGRERDGSERERTK
jgi:hypothetical protein